MDLNNFLGITELNEMTQKHLHSYLIVQTIFSFVFSLTGTFFMLYAIDKIGWFAAGTMMSVLFIVQLLFDYPSGSLGDYIGQRWVIVLATLSFSLSNLVLAFARELPDFLLTALFMGLGGALISGTLGAWVDTNYKKVVGDADPDRKIYGFATSRVGTLSGVTTALSFLVGGAWSTILSRQAAFLGQIVFYALFSLLVLKFVRDIDIEIDDALTTPPRRSYMNKFTGGLRFYIARKENFLLLTGLGIYATTWTIWGNLMLFPIYYGYGGSDAGASIVRTLIFVLGIPIGIYIANVSQKVDNQRFSMVITFHALLFFPALILLTGFLAPLENTFNLIGFLGIILIQNTLTSFLFRLGNILQGRIMVDFVPSAHRNAVYSLIPTLFSLFSIPLLPFAGYLIETFGITGGLIFAWAVCLTGCTIISLALRIRYRIVDIETQIQPTPAISTA